ncbi:MAG: hypothetical protein ACREQ5_06900 [Candidatus Dormibacteria bacterium]
MANKQQIAKWEARARAEGYLHRCAVALDIFVNVLTGGNEDETISARCWRWAQAQHTFILWHWLGRIVSMSLDWIQTDHGEAAASGDLERATTIEKLEEKKLGL